MLTAELRELSRVAKPGRIGEQPFNFVGAGECGR